MPRSFFLFAPGAGAPSSHPSIQNWTQRLLMIGNVKAFDYPYMQWGRRRPDPLPQLIAAHRQALVEARRGRAAILISKSKGRLAFTEGLKTAFYISLLFAILQGLWFALCSTVINPDYATLSLHFTEQHLASEEKPPSRLQTR